MNTNTKIKNMMNQKQIKKYRRNYNKERKDVIYNALGGYKCNCPGWDCWHEDKCVVTDERCLQLDHKNGGGTQEIKDLGINGINRYMYFIKNLERTKTELQVMCANCNWVKRMNNKEHGRGSY